MFFPNQPDYEKVTYSAVAQLFNWPSAHARIDEAGSEDTIKYAICILLPSAGMCL